MQFPVYLKGRTPRYPAAMASCRGELPAPRQAAVNRTPIHIGEKCVDVFRPILGRIVEDESVFPDVHNQDRNKPRHVARLVHLHPMIEEKARRGILAANRPAYAAHLAYARKLPLPALVTAPPLLGGFTKSRAARGGTIAMLAQVPEIMLMHPHPVIFKTETALEL